MKIRSNSLAAFLALLGLSIMPFVATAAEFRTGDAPSYASGVTLADDLYLLGGSVSSSGTVKGDLITAGGNILINGSVSGDVAAGGGNITIISDIGDDVRVGGGTIVIQGSVVGDVVAGGGQITISGKKVGGDIAAAGGVVRIDAPIGGDARIVGGEIHLNSTIGGNVDIQAENIVLGPKASIAGSLTYKSPKEMTLETGAAIKGEVKYTPSPDVREAAKLGLAAFISIWVVAKVLMIFSGALIVGYVFQRYASELVARATEKPLAALTRGIVFVIVVPIVSVALLFTVIGIAFGVLGILGFTIMIIVGAMLTPVVLGSVAHKLIFKPISYQINWKTILLGTLMYFALGLIPVLGWLAGCAAMLVSIGAALSIKAKVVREWR